MHLNMSPTCFEGPRGRKIEFRDPGPGRTISACRIDVKHTPDVHSRTKANSTNVGPECPGLPITAHFTGFGPRKNRKMAGVDDMVVYMQTGVKYNTFYIHHPGGAKRPRGGVYTNCCISQQFAYTPPNGPHQPFHYFF